MDCWPPCSPWCNCINGGCQPAPVTINAVRLRTPDGRYLQAANGGGGLLVAANIATPLQWETFLFAPPTMWPLRSGDPIALDVCNASWGPSGLRVRVDHNVKTWPPKKGQDRLVSYFVGGPGARVYVNAGFSAGYPAYPGSEKEPLERIFDIVKVGGGVINNGDQVALRINSNFSQTFFFRTTGGQNGAEIHGDGTALGQTGTLFVVEFNEVRTNLGWRPPVVQCQTCATVTGTVSSAASGLPIANAKVEALGVLEDHEFNATTTAVQVSSMSNEEESPVVGTLPNLMAGWQLGAVATTVLGPAGLTQSNLKFPLASVVL